MNGWGGCPPVIAVAVELWHVYIEVCLVHVISVHVISVHVYISVHVISTHAASLALRKGVFQSGSCAQVVS